MAVSAVGYVPPLAPTGQQQYWQGPPSGPGGAGPAAGGVGPDGTQYGPWAGQQYGGSGGGFLVTDPVRPPKRGKGPFVLLGVLVVLVLVGSALVVLHLRDASSNQTGRWSGTR